MKFERSSGILLHPTSLPGPYGIGDLGPSAYRFLDWLARSGCKLWQVLPLGPTGYGDSPYQCFSAFAGNPYLISPDFLLRDGFLDSNDLVEKSDFASDRVDFGRVIPWKLNLLERAFIRFKSTPEAARQSYDHFCAENVNWLHDYALFMAIKEFHGGGDWSGWPAPLRKQQKVAIEAATKELADAIQRYTFYQFLFFRQWNDLRAYAHQLGLKIIGDIPIFVAYDSADVWAHTELFFLNQQDKPTVVAGVPPDGFSATGQLWGNPLYRWDVHRDTGYAWWMERISFTLQMVDVLRLDHFRGFAGYYEIPAEHKTAENGQWVPGPGEDFFHALMKHLDGGLDAPDSVLPIIAEDLGLITPDVVALLEAFGFPGMKVLQFGFSGPDNDFLPHNYVPNCVAYTGTHDNDTSRGWYASADAQERDFAERYLESDGDDFPWDLIRAAWSSVAVYAVTPMQDVLNLGNEARMNFPGHLGGNWSWRMSEDVLTDALQARLKEMNYLYRR